MATHPCISPVSKQKRKMNQMNKNQSGLPATSCSAQEEPCTSPGQHSRAKPVGRGVGEPAQSCKHGRAVPITHLSYGGMGRGEIPTPPPPTSGPEVTGEGEGALALICYSTRERGPNTKTGLHRRADPEGVDVGDLTLRTWKQDNRPCPLLIA